MGAQVPTAIKNPNNDEMKKVTLSYCMDNLTKQTETAVKGLELKQSLHDLRMQEVDEEQYDVDKEDFDTVVNTFRSKKTKSYDFLLKSGHQYRESVYKLCRKMILKEEFPTSFREKNPSYDLEAEGPFRSTEEQSVYPYEGGFLAKNL